MIEDNLGAAVLAAGALGTAAFGIVEGLKRWRLVGEAGFEAIVRILGPLMDTLRSAYGPDAVGLLRAQYRGDSQELARIMRQGTRLGLSARNAEKLAAALGVVGATELAEAAAAVESGHELTAEQRNVIGRFELAADARIDAAMILALDRYKGTVRITASFIAVGIALGVGEQFENVTRLESLLIGIAAVPLAPVAKDVATAVRAAAEALRARV
jgi:hypothetical protein